MTPDKSNSFPLTPLRLHSRKSYNLSRAALACPILDEFSTHRVLSNVSMGGSLNSFVDPSAYEGRGDTTTTASVSAMRKDIADVVVIKRELSSSLLIVFPPVIIFVAARFVTIGRTSRTGGDNDVLTGTANPFAMSMAHETSKTMANVNRLAVVMTVAGGCFV